jgi:hypothetical protein
MPTERVPSRERDTNVRGFGVLVPEGPRLVLLLQASPLEAVPRDQITLSNCSDLEV